MNDEDILKLSDGLPMALCLMGRQSFVPSDYERFLLEFGRAVAGRARDEALEDAAQLASSIPLDEAHIIPRRIRSLKGDAVVVRVDGEG